MEHAKIENLLNLALDATEQEREKSLNLDVGYDPAQRTWEVIVRVTGEGIMQILRLSGIAGVTVTLLSDSYAILILPETLVDPVASLSGVIYMEKPKRLFFALNEAKRASCITPLQRNESGNGMDTVGVPDQLSGAQVLIAVIDSGIDYMHPDFRNDDGTTRIAALWDQTLDAQKLQERNTDPSVRYAPPDGFSQGVLFREDIINQALQKSTESDVYRLVPSRDLSGHGTHVAGIAAGNGRASGGRYRGVAWRAELLIVKLGTAGEETFPRTTQLMTAVDFCIREAERMGRPLVINLSYGNNYGSHSGSSLLETYLNDMANLHQCSIVTGTGNEGDSRLHYQNRILQNETQTVEFAVGSYETRLNLQIWKRFQDTIQFEVLAPDGRSFGILSGRGTFRLTDGRVTLLIFYGEPVPYSMDQEIYIDFIPQQGIITSGVWKIRLISENVVDGTYQMWLPSGGVLNESTGFFYPSEERTMTIPSTASGVITVAAYDSFTDSAAAFSGRGYTAWTDQIKPDLAAPGVQIVSAAPGGGYTAKSGTSMAVPFVSGGAALLMEWGIVGGRDPFLYGEKLKAYLIRGARKLPVFPEYPNPQVGWGCLCISESLP